MKWKYIKCRLMGGHYWSNEQRFLVKEWSGDQVYYSHKCLCCGKYEKYRKSY